MLKNRPGFTLGEVMVALVLTGVIGAAVTGVFISQSQFFDVQEKAGSARAVSRGALNILMSEMRMVESGGGVIEARDSIIRLRVPYRMGIACTRTGAGVFVSFLPADPSVTAGAVYAGYAFRRADGSYQYMDGGASPSTPFTPRCLSNSITIVSGGEELRVHPTAVVDVTRPVFIYQNISYAFGTSAALPGERALFRRVGTGAWEELVAPFSSTARFQYYVSDAATSSAAPADLTTITGIELTLDGKSERPNSDGTYRNVPFRTSVFFRNRL